MRRAPTALVTAAALALATAGGSAAHNPPGDPLPVNGEPNCFGARVSHGASEHGLTPAEKIEAIESIPAGLFPAFDAYFAEHGVSVKSIQNWIRINCSDDPLIPNP